MDTKYLINVELDGDSFIYEGNETGILLLHGLRATTAEVRLLANAIRPQGYTIHAPLLSGHGLTPEKLSTTAYKEWLNDADEAYKVLSKRCHTVYVAGESMGALLALYLAAIHQEISAVVCYSPAIIVKKIWLSIFAQYIMKELPQSYFRDALPWKGYAANPTKAIVQLYKLQRYIRARLPAIKSPVCVFIGKQDRRISLNSGRYILDRVNANDTEIHYYQNSPHCMILADDLPDIAHKTVQFLQNHPV